MIQIDKTKRTFKRLKNRKKLLHPFKIIFKTYKTMCNKKKTIS